jgi:hypothetical protein
MTNVTIVTEMTVVQLWQEFGNYFLQHEVPNGSVRQHPASSSADIALLSSKGSEEKFAFFKKEQGLMTWYTVSLDKFPTFQRQLILLNVGTFSPNDSVTSYHT